MRVRLPFITVALAAGTIVFLAGAPVVHANGGIGAGQNPLTAWNVNPLPSLLLFLAAYLYVNGLANWERPSHRVTIWQKASFFAGLLTIFLALQTPIDSLAEHSFAFHQLQHILIRMVGPLLMLLGAPLTPMLRGLPPWARLGIVRPIVRNPTARRAYELLTNPVLTTVFFLSTLYVWQIPAAHNLGLHNYGVHQFMHFLMAFSGFMFFWLVIDPKPHRSKLHYGLRVLYLGLIVIPNTLLGAAITFSNDVLYSGYAEVTQPFGLSLMTDQQLGGLLLWVPGDMMSIIVAGVVMVMWYQRENEGAEVAAAPR